MGGLSSLLRDVEHPQRLADGDQIGGGNRAVSEWRLDVVAGVELIEVQLPLLAQFFEKHARDGELAR